MSERLAEMLHVMIMLGWNMIFMTSLSHLVVADKYLNGVRFEGIIIENNIPKVGRSGGCENLIELWNVGVD